MNKLNKYIVKTYNKRAEGFDFTTKLFYLSGYRVIAYRKMAAGYLGLKPGDHVVDRCCGTGPNFSLLQNYIGEQGRITGVDITPGMLRQAEKRIKKKGWKNVQLIESDVAQFDFPQNIDGVISTYSFSFIPEYEKVIKKIYSILPHGGRFVDLGIKMPRGWLRFFMPFIIWLLNPFGDPHYYIHVKVWEKVQEIFDRTDMKECYGGLSYIVTGHKK